MTKAIIVCLIYALCNVTGTTLMKWNLKDRQLNSVSEWLQFFLNFQVILAFAIIFGSALILFKALSLGTFTFIIPAAVGINFIFTVIAGYYIFKDHLNVMSFLGFSLIISGIVLLSLNSTQYAK